MHEPGLHPAFVPAGTLLEPRAKPSGRLLISGRRDRRRTITEPMQPNAEIGVFGHITRVPAADPPQRGGTEMVRRSAERKRQPQRGKARQKGIELSAESAVNMRARH